MNTAKAYHSPLHHNRKVDYNKMATAEFFLHKGSPTYIHPENADVMSISQFMAQNLRQPPPIPPPPKHTFEISEGESVEIEKIVAAEKKVNREC